MTTREKTPLLISHSERHDADNSEQYDIQSTGSQDETTLGCTAINDDEDETVLTYSGSHIVCKSIEVSQKDPTKTSNMECLMHLLKGMIGTGILAMPIAFKNGGLWFSFGVVFLFGIICTHCMYILVQCGNEICKRTGMGHLDYAGVMEKAFETGHPRLRPYGNAAKNFINGFLLMTQFGFCIVYIVFIAQNVQQVLENWFHYTHHKVYDKLYIVGVTVLVIPYCMVKSLKALAPCSAFANFINSTGLVIVLVSLFQGLPPVSTRPAFSNISNLPLFFGQAIYAFEGIGLVLPLHNKMREKSAFLGRAGVLNLGLTITICLYVAVGFYGYLKFGDDALGSVTLNLGHQAIFQAVKLMFAVSLFISYGLQYYVPINIIWPYIEKKAAERNRQIPGYMEYLFRATVVLITGAIAVAIPHLDLLISLVGAFSSSFLALILPPLIELVAVDTTWWMKLKDWTIIIVGLLGFATGTYVSLQEIIQTF